MIKNILYYGYDRETYNDVREMIEGTNHRQNETVATAFSLLMLLTSILSTLNILPKSDRFLYYAFLLAGLVYTVMIIVLKRFTGLRSTIPAYLGVAMLIAYAIMSSRSDPFQIGVVFPAMLLVVSVGFIDNMFRFPLVLIASVAVFSIVSYFSKPPSVAKSDLFYALIFGTMSLLLHYRFQHSRIEQFLTYHKNREIQNDLIVQSSFDALSSLLVRGRFFSLANAVLKKRGSKEYSALCILDLDSFKQINDQYGHQMGDKAIQTAAGLIWKELDADLSEKWTFCERAANDKLSFAGRLGGDEFVIYLHGSDWETTDATLRRILDSLNAVDLGSLKGICASFGVTEIRDDDSDIDSVYARADAALYEAKTSGKNRIVRG